jgi:Protein of unknown function (DUF1501)
MSATSDLRQPHDAAPLPRTLTRRGLLQTSFGALGVSLPGFLNARNTLAAGSLPGPQPPRRAGSCIVLYCWGGMSHHETWDPKPEAPAEVRGEFRPIATATTGIQFGEHLPFLARQTGRLAIIRSLHHTCTGHGKAMYWNMTGHAPPQPEVAANLRPSRSDWPSIGAVVSKLRGAGNGPGSVRLPYPLVDNRTLQAGEYGGWLGSRYDPIVVRTPRGTPFGGVSRDLGTPVLDLVDGVDRTRLGLRRDLLSTIDSPPGASHGHGSDAAPSPFEHFRQVAFDLLLSRRVQEAFDLDREPESVRREYGDHIGGQSMLLARRLTEVGVPLVTVCCAAGDLNGSQGDHWDTHADNFNRLKKTMLPAFDRPAAALLDDLARRGRLDDTLVVFLTEFGRTPRINAAAGRDHYPLAYSVALAGGGIAGGHVYGSSDRQGAAPDRSPCGPNDLHATIFAALGIPPDTHLIDPLGRPFPITDGRPLPLFA